MENQTGFACFHPAVGFLYFGLTIGFSMFVMQPIFLAVSLLCSFIYFIRLKGIKQTKRLYKAAVPLLLLTAIINPLLNHNGSTVLFQLPSQNPLTLESVLYGIAAGGMLAAILLWFSCYSQIMTTEKFLYLFGKIIPSLSLVISMALRFVPRFHRQFSTVMAAQAGLGRDVYNGSIFQRLKNAIACFSITVTWALENAVETADSMKSRGYGLKGRTAFSTFTFSHRDLIAVVWLCACGIYLAVGCACGGLSFNFFPTAQGMLFEPLTLTLEVVFFALCTTPLFIDIKEAASWKLSKSQI